MGHVLTMRSMPQPLQHCRTKTLPCSSSTCDPRLLRSALLAATPSLLCWSRPMPEVSGTGTILAIGILGQRPHNPRSQRSEMITSETWELGKNAVPVAKEQGPPCQVRLALGVQSGLLPCPLGCFYKLPHENMTQPHHRCGVTQ